jgi:RNA polymerase sigma-70 factor (ECF subfamily)
LQDTFLQACRAIHAFEGRASVCSWLTRIAINSALMILRRRRARAEILFDPQPDAGSDFCSFEIRDYAPNPEQVCDLRQRRVDLLEAICNLKDHLRIPLQMQMSKESPIKEIGRALNMSEAAVKARLHRARRQLLMRVRRRDARAEAPSMATARRNTLPT